MESLDLNATVNLAGVDESTQKAVALIEKIIEAKTLAGELASMIKDLELEVQL